MTLLTSALLLGLFVAASGLFSGSETGLYSLSRPRVQADADKGGRMAALVQRLLRDEVGLLVTLLIANNVVNQAATYAGRGLLGPLGVPPGAREVVLTLLLTPPLFLLGELFPKDLFRRRPHALITACAPILAATRLVVFPLAVLLRAVTRALERLFGLDAHELARVRGREEAVLELLRERSGPDHERLESMARNVLGLRSLHVDRVMVPWASVETLPAASEPGAAFECVASSPHTRLPVVGAEGAVRGYVHQIDVLAAGAQAPTGSHLRPMISLEPAMPLDRALARLRASGQRAALVGEAGAPLGLVTVKDLVEEISGELARW
jgi:CBS domain containing-hemolysin-like protein